GRPMRRRYASSGDELIGLSSWSLILDQGQARYRDRPDAIDEVDANAGGYLSRETRAEPRPLVVAVECNERVRAAAADGGHCSRQGVRWNVIPAQRLPSAVIVDAAAVQRRERHVGWCGVRRKPFADERVFGLIEPDPEDILVLQEG